MSLVIDQLRLQRGDGVDLLGPLDLQLDPGMRLGLVGESGSGKSLLLQAVFGVLPRGVRRVGGTIAAFGKRLDGCRPGTDGLRGRCLAWMPQEPWQALHPQVTLEDHLALLPGIHRGEAKAQALQRLAPLLEHLGLPRDRAFLARRPHQLSGGQRQRVCLAMALSCDPDLLVLDEPTTALDGPTQAAFIRLLLDLQRQRNLGYLWITHDLGVASAACEQWMVLYGGALLEAGLAQDLLTQPRHPYLARLLAGARRLPVEEGGFLPAPQDRPPGCPYQPRCPRLGRSCRVWGAWQGRPLHGFRCEHPLLTPG